MTVKKSPPRKKRTKNELKQRRQKNVQRLDQEKKRSMRKELKGLRDDREELQHSLASVINEVKGMHEFLNTDEAKNKLPDESLAHCHEAIGEFKKELTENKDVMKFGINELKELEEQGQTGNTDAEDIMLPYNMTATSLIQNVFDLTQQGADVLITCNDELEKHVEAEEQPTDTESTEAEITDDK